MRLAANIRAGSVTERPVDTTARYIQHTQQSIPLTLTAPPNNSAVNGSTTVSGTTVPNAKVDVDVVNIDLDGSAVSATATAASDGSFSIPVTTPAGTDVITVAATAPSGATGFAQATVIFDFVPGTVISDVHRPVRRRQRSRNVRLSDLGQLQAWGVRPAAVPDL